MRLAKIGIKTRATATVVCDRRRLDTRAAVRIIKFTSILRGSEGVGSKDG
jgi:hypothetical protein